MLRVRRNGQLINKYTYDQTTGFLIREDNADTGISYTYTYDTVGNILSRRSYSFTVGDLGEEIEYTAKDWNYSGNTFNGIGDLGYFYTDAMGNVTQDWETLYTWNGRELTSYRYNEVFVSYSYNSDGIRTDKVREEYGVTMETVHYVLDGSTIVSETRKDGYDMVTHQFYYYYDENGSPVGLNWNGQDYYYYKNIFGDVLGIFNSSGTLVVRYAYDAWGSHVSITGSMANTLGQYNPFRYRGYYLDTETGMYYLNARYYKPDWCRFISPDPVLDATSAVGCNLFAYCGNDPVNRVDPTGEIAITIGSIVIGGSIIGWIDAGLKALTAGTVIYSVLNPPKAPSSSAPKPSVGTQVATPPIPQEIKDKIAKSIERAKTIPLYKTPREWHHIVARTDSRAAISRSILESVEIDIDSSDNLVPVRTIVHRRLHSNLYYNWVNNTITKAYNSASGPVMQRIRVLQALDFLKIRLGGM